MKEIKLTQGKVALVDDADFDWLNSVKWSAHKSDRTFYATRHVNEGSARRFIKMHQLVAAVMGLSRPDHKDGNGLNNQRGNLRAATPSQQAANRQRFSNNSSGFKGVYWRNRHKKWEAQIRKNGVLKSLGYFDVAEKAAHAYDDAAIALFGEFAQLNFCVPSAASDVISSF